MQISSKNQTNIFAVTLVLVNLIFLYVRPQSIIDPNGVLNITAILGILNFLACLPRIQYFLKYKVYLIIGAFLAFEAIHIVLGYLVFKDMILNDGVAYKRFVDLLTYHLLYIIPLLVTFTTTESLRKLVKLFLFISFSLAVFSLLKEGRGVGGFNEDENDNCLAIMIFFSYAVFFTLIDTKGTLKKIVGAGICLVSLLGMVYTNSRGGFIGLLAVYFYVILKTPYKLKLITFSFFTCIVGVWFIPDSYYMEVLSILEDSSIEVEGTGRERLLTWGYVLKMIADPIYTIWGVGMDNTPWTIHLYQGPKAGVEHISFAGRATHSVFFQVLGDFGIIGVVFFSYLGLRCYITNERVYKKSSYSLHNAKAMLKKQPQDAKNIKESIKTLEFYRAFSLSTNCAIIATLSCGAFISILYYPHIWFLVALTEVNRENLNDHDHALKIK